MLEKLFHFSKFQGASVKKELLAGATTFLTMAYVLATIPKMLANDYMNESAILSTMILLIIFTTVLMAFVTNRPFALAPGLGSVAIVSGMIQNENISPEISGGIIFISGVVFVLISFLGLREQVVRAIPKSLKYSVSAGVGLFIALIGSKACGLIIADSTKKCLTFGPLISKNILLALIGFMLILFFKARKIPGDIFIAIIITTLIGIPMGVTKIPTQIVSLPKHFILKVNLDIIGALKLSYIPFVIALFIPDFFSTFGTVIGVGAKAGYLDENGDLPGIDKCFQVDAISTVLGSIFCMPSMTTYLESSAGVEVGGKTGLSVIFTSICFFFALFLSPIALMIPKAATAPALIFIGMSMLSAMKNINYDDFSDYFPSFVCIIFTIFANNIANGITMAIPTYVFLKICKGKAKEIPIIMYILVFICFIYFYMLARK